MLPDVPDMSEHPTLTSKECHRNRKHRTSSKAISDTIWQSSFPALLPNAIYCVSINVKTRVKRDRMLRNEVPPRKSWTPLCCAGFIAK